MFDRKRPQRIEIVFKSGRVARFRCAEFSTTRNTVTNELTRITWDDARPVPSYVRLSEVESVWRTS